MVKRINKNIPEIIETDDSISVFFNKEMVNGSMLDNQMKKGDAVIETYMKRYDMTKDEVIEALGVGTTIEITKEEIAEYMKQNEVNRGNAICRLICEKNDKWRKEITRKKQLKEQLKESKKPHQVVTDEKGNFIREKI